MKKELLTIEFRYRDKPISDLYSEHKNKIITIGVFDTLDEAIIEGNKALQILSNKFKVKSDDKFQLNFLFGSPKKLVTNCCYPTNGIQYFAKIETLNFDNLTDFIDETFKSFERYNYYKSLIESK